MRILHAGWTLILVGAAALLAQPPALEQKPNTWVKRSPLKDGPISPGMGYEASLGYDPKAKLVIRWGGHNQGGGGEQNAETWTFDPLTARWTLKEPNTSPPGVCCAQQNVFDPDHGRFLRFPAFSGSHGWHWFRENYLSNSAVWSYDLATNTWRDLRPAPTPHPRPLRCASWDSDHAVAVLFGGEGSGDGTLVYDPHTNTWTRMQPRPEPAPRSGGNMVYDPVHRRHVLFGTQFGNDAHTWTYDLRKNEWSDRKPAVQPPTDRNDPVLAYDVNSKQVIALVRVLDNTEGKEVVKGHLETWAYHVGRNTWTPQKPAREPDGWGNRRRIMVAVPDQNLVLVECYVNPTERVPGVDREQQIWTYRPALKRGEASPLPASGLTVKTEAKKVILEWKPSPSRNIVSYRVYGRKGGQPWQGEMRRLAELREDQTSYHDTAVEPGSIYHYTVYAVARGGPESLATPMVRAQPRVVEDGVVSVIGAKEVRLRWKSPAADVTGYHVERAVVEVFSEDEVLRLKKDTPPLDQPSVGTIKALGPFQRLTTKPLQKPEYTDTAIDLSRPKAIEGDTISHHRFRADQLDAKGKAYRYAVFAYRIRAVNALGVESGPSPYFLTIPSAPQWVFSKEDGDSCHLKWAKNPEEGIKGYRIYRMEGPKINGPGQPVTRLTADPVTETRWTDNKATKETKRYWIVAVDALGQEGIPSAPVWHSRQWRKYYVPFIGEWHQ
jgi:hypothetical protein